MGKYAIILNYPDNEPIIIEGILVSTRATYEIWEGVEKGLKFTAPYQAVKFIKRIDE